MRWAGVVCLGLAALMAMVLAWPSSRARIDVSLSGDQMQSAWVKLEPPSGVQDVSPVPSLMLSIDLPESVLRGREERIRLVVDAASEGSAPAIYSLAAEAISVDASITPPGESGQPLRAGADFEWTMVATHAPQASATILVRLRRYSPEGATEAERLVLARDVVLAVRGVAGLSAPIARLAASALGLTGALLGIASFLSRTR